MTPIIKIKFHERARERVNRFYIALGASEKVRRDRWDRFLTMLEDVFRQQRGLPISASGGFAEKNEYWLQLEEQFFIQFLYDEVPPKPRSWWQLYRILARMNRGYEIRVTITDLQGLPRFDRE